MSSISYKYQLVLEKIIKSKFAELLKLGGSFNNYISMMTILSSKVCEIIRNSIVEFFEELTCSHERCLNRLSSHFCNIVRITLIVSRCFL